MPEQSPVPSPPIPPNVPVGAAPDRRRRRLRLFFTIAATMIVLLAIASEITLRLAWGIGDPLLYRPDPQSAYVVAPNQHLRLFGARNDINAFSMRSVDITAEKPPGTVRVFFIGDSVIYGTTYVDQSLIATSLLQARLPTLLNEPVQVLNASAGGWATYNEVGYLRSHGTFGADLIIEVLNTNDLDQPMAFATFEPNGNFPGRKPHSAIESLLIRYLWPRLMNRLHAGLSDPGIGLDAMSLQAEVGVLKQLDEANAIATKAGARYAIVYSPNAVLWHRADAVACKQMFLDWAGSRHVPVIDMTAAYESKPFNIVYQDGLHLRPGGQELIAEAVIANWLRLMGSGSGARP